MDFNANNDQENFKEKAKNFFDRQGFYVVLIACIAILGVTAFFTYRGTQKEVPQAELAPSAQPANLSQDEQLAQATRTPLPTITPTPTVDATPEPSTTPTPTPEAKKTQAKKKTPALYNPPVDGELIKPFAIDSLIYSKTLNQWTSHKGIDIAASEGAVVRAIDSGIVSRVENDTMLGYCLELKHDTGLISVYCNLAEMPVWKKGDAVKVGDVVGNIGNSSISESSDPPHLHFELYDGDKLLDPATRVNSLAKLPSTEETLEPTDNAQ